MTRWAAAAVAVTALVVIGTVEARESARQLDEAARSARISPAGAGLTAIGLVASVGVYLALGRWSGADRDALRLGALTGATAGLIGGAVRAWLVADGLQAAIARYAAVPGWFTPAVLGIFIALCVVVSAAGGAACAFIGVRLSTRRAGRSERDV